MSSPIAHAAAGYAIYSAFRRKFPSGRLLGLSSGTIWPAIIVFLCLIPDLDAIIAFILGSFERFHNNLSHSLLACAVIPLLLTPLLNIFTRLSLKTSFLLILICCYSHIIIDLFTMSRGVMLFWPFSTIRIHAPISLFVGVPWSSKLTNPFYLLMAINDLCFAASLTAIVFVIRIFTKKKELLIDVQQTTLLVDTQPNNVFPVVVNKINRTTSIFAAFIVLMCVIMSTWWIYDRIQPRNIPILMYHRIGSEQQSVWWVPVTNFENQIMFLKSQGYESILPSDLVTYYRWAKPLPKKPVILTFDDGYLNSMQNAEPILKKYGFRGIVYLVTEKIAENDPERKNMEDTPTLIWPEIRAMYKRGTLTFGGHSRTHPNILTLSEPYWEIRGCYTDIQKKGGFKPDSFCYPNGQYNPKIISAVKRAGFTAAMTCNGALFQTDRPTSLFELPRLAVYGGESTYHVETMPPTNDAPTITLKVWKEGVSVPSFPRLVCPSMEQGEGWKDPVQISTNPVTLAWDISKDKLRAPLSFELWGDCKLLPHWKQSISTNNLKEK